MRRSGLYVINDLETGRVSFIANMIDGISHTLSRNDLGELTQIAEAFNNAKREL
jgi:hypothetical protein